LLLVWRIASASHFLSISSFGACPKHSPHH
jgi:hypothetical protein